MHEAFAQVPNTWEDPKCVVALGAVRADALQDAPGLSTGHGAEQDSTVPLSLLGPERPVPVPSRSRRRLVGALAVILVAVLVGAFAFKARDGSDVPAVLASDVEPSTTIARRTTTTTDGTTATTVPSLPAPGPGGQPDQAPSAGSAPPQVAPPTSLAPRVSATPTVPSVVGKDLNGALASLEGAGYRNHPWQHDCHGSNNKGAVVRQEPAGGARSPTSTPVRLDLQANNCAFVPSVIGSTLTSASATLTAAGFNDQPYLYGCYGSPKINTVVSQDPSGGQVPTSTPIRLFLQANDC